MTHVVPLLLASLAAVLAAAALGFALLRTTRPAVYAALAVWLARRRRPAAPAEGPAPAPG
jgi:hypothetical protein